MIGYSDCSGCLSKACAWRAGGEPATIVEAVVESILAVVAYVTVHIDVHDLYDSLHVVLLYWCGLHFLLPYTRVAPDSHWTTEK